MREYLKEMRVCSFLSVGLTQMYIQQCCSGLIVIVCLSRCEFAAITLSRLATVALAACGWRQTQHDGKQPFIVAGLSLAFLQCKSVEVIQRKN